MAVRAAVPGDAPAMARVEVETWRDAYPGVLPDDFLTRRLNLTRAVMSWRRALAGGDGDHALVAVVSGPLVVGTASAGRARRRIRGLDGELHTLYVLPDWQDCGAGRALLRAAARRLERDGRKGLLVEVLDANPARFFYERMGGQPHGEGVHDFAGVKLAVRFYGWPDISMLC